MLDFLFGAIVSLFGSLFLVIALDFLEKEDFFYSWGIGFIGGMFFTIFVWLIYL